ncbi:MAG: hypothetical protein JNJ75_10570 [Cyclobacteriaceae bacterium]|nr:hypothetical protein [Cyclobacteriaceae bacterium]
MATAVISPATDLAADWTRQFCRIPPWTTQIREVPRPTVRRVPVWLASQSRIGVVEAFRVAATRAGGGGHIIYNNGHGAAQYSANTMTTLNMLDLHDSDFKVTPLSFPHKGNDSTGKLVDMPGDEDLAEIGKILRSVGGITVTLVVCSIGKDIGFLQQLKNFWKVPMIRAYKNFIKLSDDPNAFPGYPDQSSYPRVRMHFMSDYPNRPEIPPNSAEGREMAYRRQIDADLFGPDRTPLPPPQPVQVNSATVPYSWLELPKTDLVRV